MAELFRHTDEDGETLQVVGNGHSRAKDLHELVHHLHAIQHTVMSQAAARAYPNRYRLLGGTVEGPEVET